MKKNILLTGICLISFLLPCIGKDLKTSRQSYKIYVDKEGVMRRSDTKEEVSYYGTNYTLPFAHAYRAVGELGIDRKEAIDKDVYHLKRLGFNGFRLHLWDVELSDSAGNLMENEHLDLLDYLISQLEKEGIDIILTAQTNFGNGYPEKNVDTGAYSYDYDKCEIHSNETAQQIQANYLKQLASHVNPYTGLSYSNDNAIIAMEINNEPCHTGAPKDVTAYINKMVKALKQGGFDKPILYNASHNPDVTEAYYDANIQGTTFQWYPTGLVAGHERKGNFLPYVQQYPIIWKDSIKNYNKKTKVVYEFDPADVLYSHLYPAVARTFRKEGFQWITQFAYDPIDIAKYNTEYQTHFLNLAYTPSKAISMLIAGEVSRNIPRGVDFGNFPTDTVFDDFLVSYIEDLSMYNNSEKYYHSNKTSYLPKEINKLKKIAGVGSSPIVEYNGTGAYFLDELQPGLWRLEIMPDIVITSDPFTKPSPQKEVGKIFYNNRPILITLPQLGKNYYYQAINASNSLKGEAKEGKFDVYPGVYLLSDKQVLISDYKDSEKISEVRKYVAPSQSNYNSVVIFDPIKYINPDEDLTIEVEIIGQGNPDEVTLYPQNVSFWNEKNSLFPMTKNYGNTYTVIIPKEQLGFGDSFGFNIVVKENGKLYTWPQNIKGTPLDWDFNDYRYYTLSKLRKKDPVVLLSPSFSDKNIDTAMIPEAWDYRFTQKTNSPIGPDYFNLFTKPGKDSKIIIRRYVGDELNQAPFLKDKSKVIVKLWPQAYSEGGTIGLTGKNGATYSAFLKQDYIKELPTKLHQDYPQGIEFEIPLSDFVQTETNIVPAVYPTFLPRELKLDPLSFNIDETEFVELVFKAKAGEEKEIQIQGIWLE